MPAAATPDDLIPLEDFFDNPERAAAQLSPDGRRLGYLAPEEGHLNVVVRDLVDGTERFVSHDHTRGIRSFHWCQDSTRLLYPQDAGGDENFHVFLVSADGGAARDLTPFAGVRAEVILTPASDPGAVVVSMNRRVPALQDLVRIDLATGDLTELTVNPGNVVAYIPDLDGRPMAALVQAPTGDWTIAAVDGPALRPVRDYSNGDLALDVFGVGTERTIYLGTRQPSDGSWETTDRSRLVSLDLVTGAQHDVSAGESDVAGLVTAEDGTVLAVAYQHERHRLEALDADFAPVLDTLAGLAPGDLADVSMDRDRRRFVAAFTDDRAGVAYHLHDRDTGASELLFTARPRLDPARLAPMRPVTITARDGLPLTCYLTLPRGAEHTNLPLVLLVHGGPWARDSWGFHPEVQFLANRGYAVLQVNYRGSTGFGKRHYEAAIGEFAGAMHDDLIDALEWAVAAGHADRSRLGIYGGSYGGYATLVGVTFTPDVFAAAVSYVGPSSLVTLVESFPDYWGPALAGSWYRFVGNPATPADREDMLARSPITRVDSIVTPLLVIQGANDPRVTQAESDAIVEALRGRGVDVDYILAEDEGHGFLNPQNKFRAYRAMESFLATHLGGRSSQ